MLDLHQEGQVGLVGQPVQEYHDAQVHPVDRGLQVDPMVLADQDFHLAQVSLLYY